MDETTKKAAALFGGDCYATKTTGAVLEEARENYARCSLALEPRHKNANGQVMGGAIFTLADFAFAVASNGPEMQTPTVTLSSTVEFLAPAKGARLTAETSCLKAGRRVCVFEILVSDEDGTPVAKITATGCRV
jgi:acyl-CoA thioesterase